MTLEKGETILQMTSQDRNLPQNIPDGKDDHGDDDVDNGDDDVGNGDNYVDNGDDDQAFSTFLGPITILPMKDQSVLPRF